MVGDNIEALQQFTAQMKEHTNRAHLTEAETKTNTTEIARLKNRVFGTEAKLCNQENHLALVQNYVDRYVPVAVQVAISENIKTLPFDVLDLEEHTNFVKEEWTKLHMVILNDNGEAEVY